MVTRINVPKAAKRATRKVAAVAAPVARQAGNKARKIASDAAHSVSHAVSGSLGLGGHRMSKVDTAWLRMDSESNLMMIVGIWVLKPGVSRAALCQRIEERLLKYPRFMQRVEQDATGATWVVDEHFAMDRHVVVEKLARKPKGQEQAALQDRVAELAVQPLDQSRPLWQFHLVEDYQDGSALIVRIHHCIADGIALIAVALSLVDGSAQPPRRAPAAPAAPASLSLELIISTFQSLFSAYRK